MFFSLLLLVSLMLGLARSRVSSSLYRAVEVRSDSLSSLPLLDEVVRRDVMSCGLSCSSRQDCPGFSYSSASQMCSRLELGCVPGDLLSDNQTSHILLYMKEEFSQPCGGKMKLERVV